MDDLQKWFLEHASDEAVDKSFEELVADFGADDFVLSSEGFNQFRQRVGKKTSGKQKFLQITERLAAILLIPITVTALILGLRKPAEVQWSEVYTLSGQTRSVTLPDGSVIRLAPESHILYPSAFSGDIRQVFLTGEAYANIVHMDKCPFEIRAEDIIVTVFGTEFNFSSYQSDSECELALVDGTVEMRIDGKDADHTILMKTGDMLRYERASGSIEKQRFSVDTYLANANRGGLQFSNRKMGDIAQCLERRFGVEIVIEDAAIAEERYFAAFINGEDLPSILQSLNMQNHMCIKKKENTYYLSLK